MNRPTALVLALLTPLALAWSVAVEAQSCTNGRAIYTKTSPNVPASCSNSSCHGNSPNSDALKGAGNSVVIENAVDTSDTGKAMYPLSLRDNLPLSSSDFLDLAEYFFWAATTGACPANAPAVSASPTSLAFGSVNTGSSSAPQVITVSNTGSADATGMSYPAAPSGYSRTTSCTATLNMGASCTVSFTFSPTAAGANNSGWTVTGGNGINIPISLSGTGAAPPALTPNLQASPSGAAFGSVAVGQTSAATNIVLTNTGTGSAPTPTFGNPNATEFVISGNTCTGAIAAGASCSFNLAYQPANTGADNATLTISYTGGPAVNIAMSGTGTAAPVAVLQVTPGFASFGSVNVGLPGTTQPFTVSNIGNAAAAGIAFANSNAAEFVVSSNTCGVNLGAGASCAFNITYTPTAMGADNATLTVSYAGGANIVLPLSGIGVAPSVPNLQLSPATAAFGNVTVGLSSAVKSYTLSNTGNAAASGIAFANGNAAEFVVSASSCGASLGAGASCAFSVTYTPTAVGADNATLTISYNGGTSIILPLSGAGTAVPVASLQLSPATAVFGNVTVGGPSAAKSYTLSNNGTAAAAGVAFANSNAAEFVVSANTCGASLSAGASCTFNITYAPADTGADNASLTISYTGGANFVLPMSGTGTAVPVANLLLSPATAVFGNVVVGASSAVKSYLLSNTGNAAAAGVSFTNSNAAEFVVSANTCGANLSAGASCAFNITYAPADTGADTGTLTIGYAGGADLALPLTGSGVTVAPPPVGQLSMPVAVTLPNQTVGSVGAPFAVQVGNIGNAAVAVSAITLTNPAEFALASSTCASVAAGATCTLSFTFTPAGAGSRSTSVNIVGNGVGSPQVLVLLGTGVAGGTPPPPPSDGAATAIEYFHAEFGHYFITAIADEIVKIDNGTFKGWARTGRSFNVYPNAAAGLNPVCRFFSTAFGVKSSHFYTPFPTECSVVKGNPNWMFEAEVFHVAVPTVTGVCPANTVPVYRMYNNGQSGAPNHRYTTDLAVRAQMLAQGWIAEGEGTIGVIMCAPP